MLCLVKYETCNAKYSSQHFADERVSCGSTRTDVSEGDAVMLVCSLALRGLSPNWQVTWMHEERPIASTTEDSDGLIKRTVQFNASYPRNTGNYRCAVTVSEFQYSSSCRVDLNVLCAYQ